MEVPMDGSGRRVERSVSKVEQQRLILQRGALAASAVCLACAAIWLIGHGYGGLRHDAVLYAMQALANADSNLFSRDLFLVFGSQDQFTLFTKLVAPLMTAVGLEVTLFVLSTFGSLLWLACMVLLANRLLLRRDERRVGILLVLVLPGYYGAMEIFAVGRALATPRVFAEGLVLLGLSVWLQQYREDGARRWSSVASWALAGISLVLAAAFHPLMAIGGFLVLGLEWSLQGKRIWLGVAAGLAGMVSVVGLALAGMAPFDRVFSAFDPAWLNVVQIRSEHLFLSGWEPRDWARLGVLLAACAAGARLLGGWRGRFATSVLVTAAAGVALNGIGADLLGNVLLTQLQFFRLPWLLHVVGPLVGGTVVIYALGQGKRGSMALALLGFGSALAWAGHAPGQAVASVLLFLLGLKVLWADESASWVETLTSRRWPAWAATAGGLLVLGLAGFAKAQYALHGLNSVDYRASAEIIQARGVPRLVLGAMLLLSLFAAWRNRSRRVVVALMALLCVASVGIFDQRTTVAIAASRSPELEALRTSIPEGSAVYWQNQVSLTWFGLRRPSFVGREQAAGVVFNRGTALEYARRLALVGGWDENFRELYPDRSALPPLERALTVCRDPDGPVALFLQRSLVDSLVPPQIVSIRGVRDHYLYFCQELLDLRSSR